MRKILISIIGALVFCTAFATGENIPTSKSYVDAGVAEKQDKIAANNGAAQVLTNTGTAGEYGTKSIYNSTGEYATQSDALIDAVTMNTAVQNAINSEFQCVEYDNQNNCLLMDVFGQTAKRSPNLFDLDTARVVYTTASTEFSKLSNGYEISNGPVYLELGNIEDFIGKTLIVSYEFNCRNGQNHTVYFYQTGSNGSPVGVYYSNPVTITRKMASNATTLAIRLHQEGSNTCAYTNIQIEEGTTATPYQPYGNIYIPSETQ